MQTDFTSPVPEPSPDLLPLDTRMQDPHYYTHILNDMLEIGAELVRIVQQDALAYRKYQAEAPQFDVHPVDSVSRPPSTGPLHEIANAYHVITRSMRLTATLAQKLADPKKPTPSNGPSPARPPAPSPAPSGDHPVRDPEAARDSTTGRPHADPSQADCAERPERPESPEDIDGRPIAGIVNEVMRDFGIAAFPDNHPWKQRIADDIAALEARAREIGLNERLMPISEADAPAASPTPTANDAPITDDPPAGIVPPPTTGQTVPESDPPKSDDWARLARLRRLRPLKDRPPPPDG